MICIGLTSWIRICIWIRRPMRIHTTGKNPIFVPFRTYTYLCHTFIRTGIPLHTSLQCWGSMIRTSDQWIRIQLLSSLILRLQLITCPRHVISSLKKNIFLLKFCVKILFCRQYFSPFHIYEKKRVGSGSGSVPLTNRSGCRSWRPKTCGSGSGSGSGSPTLLS